MPQKPTVLLSVKNKTKEEQIAGLCRRLGFQWKRVDARDRSRTLGELAGIAGFSSAAGTHNAPLSPLLAPLPELLLFSGVSDEALDRFLAAYRQEGIAPVALKAVLTPANVRWTLEALLAELYRERAELEKQQ